jgi:hypothetical protein
MLNSDMTAAQFSIQRPYRECPLYLLASSCALTPRLDTAPSRCQQLTSSITRPRAERPHAGLIANHSNSSSGARSHTSRTTATIAARASSLSSPRGTDRDASLSRMARISPPFLENLVPSWLESSLPHSRSMAWAGRSRAWRPWVQRDLQRDGVCVVHRPARSPHAWGAGRPRAFASCVGPEVLNFRSGVAVCGEIPWPNSLRVIAPGQITASGPRLRSNAQARTFR